MKESKKYHYFYKITNLLNNHFYYGVHNTNNINDGYMGSGKRLHYAYEKYGIENFEKEILKYFDTAKDAFEYEATYITEDLVKDPNCYNIQGGGDGWNTSNLVTVKDKNGNIFDVHIEDPRYLNGELVGLTKGFTNCYDTLTKQFVQIPSELFDDKRYVGLTAGFIIGRKKNETCKRYLIPKNLFNNDEYECVTNGRVLVENNKGMCFLVDKNDERYTSGLLKSYWTNKKHTEESKKKMHETHLKNHHQQGEKNSQFGTCWIHNDEKSIKIKKEQLDEYISNGWSKGRKINF